MKELQVPFDSAWILKNRRKIKKALLADGTPRMEKKIAVLGGSTTNDIVSMLELFLLENGIQPLSISRNMPVIGRMLCLKTQSWKPFSQT